MNNRSCIAIVDTGVSPHLDLMVPRNKIASFVDIVGHKKLPYDDNGHGTFVAGVVAGTGLLSGHKIVGPAQNSDLVIIKAIAKDGKATRRNLLDAIRVIVALRNKRNITTALFSIGVNKDNKRCRDIERAIDYLYTIGITTICASGNAGKGNLRSPATARTTISVGAVDANLKICDFTSRGYLDGVYKPDFYAIGKDVIGLKSSGYTRMSGTSVSAPYIAGIVAVIKDMITDVSEEEVRQILAKLATKEGNALII